jgi:hypothetical protein
MTEPAHTVKHICNSHKPTTEPKIAKELACFPSLFFAHPKNKIGSVLKLKIKWFYEWNKTQQVTLCKFHPGFGGKFMYFITLNIL